ncbi:hypothetical protein B0H17DRAFT_1089597 [Mycena rosella]|uniref:Uncharacterized protein n=1 Tax=Mycena rosella TaxID=1033263 RepID=A0AAD7CVZ1_MYCRO|nr:hypothetical protein B0H17DRAFT_1089597 [Mycena rosella]
MALNWAVMNENRSPVPLPNESTITTVDSGVELTLRVPESPPGWDLGNNATTAGGKAVTLKETGMLTVTDQRFIFTSAAANPALDSLSVPLPAILSTRFEQPTFGSNYFTFEIGAAVGGGLTPGTTAEVRFKDRAMFSFVATLEKTRERAIYMKRQKAENEEGGLRAFWFRLRLIRSSD